MTAAFRPGDIVKITNRISCAVFLYDSADTNFRNRTCVAYRHHAPMVMEIMASQLLLLHTHDDGRCCLSWSMSEWWDPIDVKSR
jgi:hypothetical protein